MFNEFKKFIARGNVMDMAVGIIIGAAFTAIVNSMVGDLIMPVVGLVTAGVDFSGLFVALDGNEYANIAAAEEAGATIMKYGLFINAVINFLIVAFVIFMLVRGVNSLKEKEAAKPAAPAADIKLLTEIRDLLKK
ncbi:MAG: large conductance mechanosensitive channel protein MscL [Alphaproteobacteria bacterium]|nr:large conductance mechanosensitive channel protein MscL [Alphaproteobacteria bacterium]